ncbi:MAG: hypothetical protein AAGI09_04400 [Pseudomonadota bacterium]
MAGIAARFEKKHKHFTLPETHDPVACRSHLAHFLAASAPHATGVSLVFDGDARADGTCNREGGALSQESSDIGGQAKLLLMETVDEFEVSLVQLDIAPYTHRSQTNDVTVVDISNMTETALEVALPNVETSKEMDRFGASQNQKRDLITVASAFYDKGFDTIVFNVDAIGCRAVSIPVPRSALMLPYGVAGLCA